METTVGGCYLQGSASTNEMSALVARGKGSASTNEMSALVARGKNTEDVGVILARVQDDLQLLRATVARAGDGAVDVDTLDSVLSRTERGVQAASEKVLASDLDHVTTLPPVVVCQSEGVQGPQQQRRRRGRRRGRAHSDSAGLLEMARHSSRQSPIHQARELSKTDQRMSSALEPSLPATRKLLNQKYSLPPTPDVRVGVGSKVTGKLHTGRTVPPLPQKHRKNISMSPRDTCISKEDAQRGLLNLIERQLIPPAADIILSPPPVKSTGIELLSAPQQFVRPSVAMEEDVCGHMVGVKLAADGHMTVTPPAELSCRPSTPHTLTLKPHRQTHVSIHVIQPQDMPTQLSQQIQRGESPTPAAPSTSDPYQITIENGQALKSSQEHHQFQSSHTGRWPHISSVLSKLERLCQQYSIPMATVHSGETKDYASILSRLVEVASDHELGLPIRREHLISCFVNSDSVKNYVTRPGQRFKGEGGKDAAAALIQATYRMYCQRCSYLQHQRQVLAVGVITTAWNLFLKRYEVRVRLAERRCRELKGHRSRSVELGKRWRNIQKGKRVIIHIPSLGYQQCVRRTEPALSMEQSLQLARIADVQDPNVEVIYISPVAVDSEILDYYSSLLAMGPNGSETAFDRIHIITPDHLHTFPSHPLPLSTILTLSPQTVKRVKRLTTGREAYIVPGVVNSDDMTIANILGVPLLGPDCEASELYSSKDGAKKIFSDANMPTPPCAMDIVSECQLLEQLAGLVASHPHIHRWLFKLPHQIRGRGFAYCDVADHLQCQQWLERESERYGDNWSSRWAQEQARRRILNELPSVLESHAIPVNSDLYPTWRAFLANFLVSGGLIEGHPPSTSTTSLTVDLFIDPTGEIELLSTQDQICAEGYVVWGVSVPQSSVAPDMLLNSARRVGVTCRGRGIMGHLSIDYVTFIHPKTLEQELWAVDLDLGYSNHLALLRLLGYVTGATVAPSSGQLTVESGPRFAILSPRVYHTNLPVIHYPVFFQTCKAHHIGYDAKEKVGTIFALFDREHKEQIGIICLQPSLSECLACYSTALRTIHQEIATPLVPGTSNFKAVTRELEAVAEQVRENEGTIIAQQTEQNSEENTILL